MITNGKITIYHKDIENHNNIWKRFVYYNTWFFGGKGSSTNKGYQTDNDCQIRIPYRANIGLNIKNFAIGDIIVPSEVKEDITSENDIKGTYYNITTIVNNIFGNNHHIHLSGK